MTFTLASGRHNGDRIYRLTYIVIYVHIKIHRICKVNVYTVGPLFIESLWAKQRVSTGVLRARDDLRVVRTKHFKSGSVPASSCRKYLASVVIFVLMLYTNCEIEFQIVVIQH